MDHALKEMCLEIEKWYEIHFLEIGMNKDHIHFGAICADVEHHKDRDADQECDSARDF